MASRMKFVVMPWHSIHYPSLGVGILTSIARREAPEMAVDTLYANIAWVDHLRAVSGGRITPEEYRELGEDLFFKATGEWVFSGAMYGREEWNVDAYRDYFGAGETFDIALSPEHGVKTLMAPRRHLLDRMLAEAAAEAGAELRYETRCAALIHDPQGRVTGARLTLADGTTREVSAGLVIGADGKRSRVARLAGAEVTRQARHTVACAYQYFSGLPNRGFRWHFTNGAAGGIIPTNDGGSCAFVALPEDSHAALRSAPVQALAARHMPRMAEDMAGAEPAEARVIFAGLKGYMRRCAGPGWALVGDASWFRDPITAHGITDAFRDSELLAEAVKSGTLSSYEARRDQLSLPIFELSDRIASLDWRLDELADLHKQLNRAMKANQAWIAGARDEVRRVA